MVAFLAALACSSRAEPDREPLMPDPAGADVVQEIQYRGELRVMESFPVQLAADVTVTNLSGEERSIDFPDGCIVLLRAHRGSERVWDQSEELACTTAIETVQLAPGASQTFRAGASAADVLGDELPDGSYRITAYLRPGGRTVEVDLGEVELGVPRDRS